MEEDRLNQILDGQIIVNEESFERANKVAHLTRRCLRDEGEERHSMKEVAVELEGILHNFMAVLWQSIKGENLVSLDLPKQTNHFATFKCTCVLVLFHLGTFDDLG